MTAQIDSLEKTILSVLAKYSPVVESAGRWRWDFALANALTDKGAVRSTLRVDDKWVRLQTRLPDAAGDVETKDWWELLCLNARLAGNAKFVLESDALSIGLQAEIPVDEDIDLSRRLDDTCGAFKAALACLHIENESGLLHESAAGSLAEETTAGAFNLRALCEETGWPHNEREDGSVAFDLQARTGFQQALVRSGSQGRVSVSADLALCAVLPVVSRQAISLMLLQASRLVRGARAVAHVSDNNAVMRFETVFSSRPTARELEHALAALSVANDLCGGETVALQDEGIAEEYLRLQGWAGKSSGSISESMVEVNEASVVAA
jgi:hypothetical protein